MPNICSLPPIKSLSVSTINQRFKVIETNLCSVVGGGTISQVSTSGTFGSFTTIDSNLSSQCTPFNGGGSYLVFMDIATSPAGEIVMSDLSC